jgi:hypothetical protein
VWCPPNESVCGRGHFGRPRLAAEVFAMQTGRLVSHDAECMRQDEKDCLFPDAVCSKHQPALCR